MNVIVLFLKFIATKVRIRFQFFLFLARMVEFWARTVRFCCFDLIFYYYFCKNFYSWYRFFMHKILIVDDERPARDFITELVTSCLPDSKVVHAENPDKALAYIEAENFDLLFVDIEMPPPYMNGLELIEAINRMGKYPFTVIISAHRTVDYTIRGYELGVARYIPKPLKESSEESEHDTIHHISKPIYDDKIFEAIQSYLNKVKNETIELKIYSGFRRVAVNQIHAIETKNRRKVDIYTSDALWKAVTEPLSQLFNRLPSYFLYIRRNCVINTHAVKRYVPKSREVFVDCQNREYSFIVSRENMKKLAALLDPENMEKDDA